MVLDRLGQFDVEASTVGGGESGKAGAIRLAIAKGLRIFVNDQEREKLRLGSKVGFKVVSGDFMFDLDFFQLDI